MKTKVHLTRRREPVEVLPAQREDVGESGRIPVAPQRSVLAGLLGFFARIGLGLAGLSVGIILLLRVVPPATSAFMAADFLESLCRGERAAPILYRWSDWETISPHMALAAMAAEDQTFPDHWGFDFNSIIMAVEERETRGRVRGASTITQQVAKNLFLWNGKSYFRKGLEAYFTVLMELCWSKKRILEVYLNIAEFGDGVYGVDAAARAFFRKPPSKLTKRDCALLAAVLPNPHMLKARFPSAYVWKRVYWLEKQMKNLGSTTLGRLDR